MSEDAYIVANTNDKTIRRRMTKANSGHYFVRALADLDEVAQTTGVRPLSEFVHYDPDIADDIAEFAEEHHVDPKWADRATYDQWYEPADCLMSIHAIQAYLGEHPTFVETRFQFFRKDPSKPRINPGQLIFEIAQFEKELRYLEGKQVRFRFEIG